MAHYSYLRLEMQVILRTEYLKNTICFLFSEKEIERIEPKSHYVFIGDTYYLDLFGILSEQNNSLLREFHLYSNQGLIYTPDK